jgi:C-terminal processing protease CtpA/Prc
MEVISVDETPVAKWLESRVAFWRDIKSFSTEQHAFFFTCHTGLVRPVGTRLELELKGLDGKKKTRTITYSKGDPRPWGPSVFPAGLESSDDLNFGLLMSGNGYIHVRRSKETLPEQIDRALEKVGGAPGLVLDFRANSGGGCDHEAFMGRFVPQGQTLDGGVRYASAGPHPYGGRIVVIVDATCVSTGETTSGIFKEDGRAYMIGESPTAGMSSQKTTIELPSGLFALYVSTASNKGRFNDGRGIEGIGVIPHELVQFDPKDLAAGTDTLIARAEELLAKFPQDKVPYKAR